MILIRISNFIKSLFFHVWSGFPKCNKDQILKRWNTCLACEEFNKEYSICNICGCNLNNKKEFFNKLAWADQECPAGKWPKEINNENKKTRK